VEKRGQSRRRVSGISERAAFFSQYREAGSEDSFDVENRTIEMSNPTLLSLLTEGHAVSYCLPTKKVQDGLFFSANSGVF